MSNLIIVESPAKAKTIAKFLNKNFIVKSSLGHIRDLPKSEMGVDIEHGFLPHYVISVDKRSVVSELKKIAKKAEQIFLATDADREGEAISWHLANILDIDSKDAQRLVFHEITADAIKDALAHPRGLNMDLVNAQQARRILDRLVGYQLSPFLWKKVARGLSAGRVQSVAVRLIVEREKERQKFQSEEYWSIEARFKKEEQEFAAKLHQAAGQTLEKLAIKNQAAAEEILKELTNAAYVVLDVTKKKAKKSTPAPFTTSTLQQEANHRLGFSAKQTMMLAQQLYEAGLITYMRTDSVNLSEKFLNDARAYIKENFEPAHLPARPKIYATKSKLAQEAHEAVRPTKASRHPASLKETMEPRLWKLYDLIWKRAVASQMAEAIFEATSVDIANDNQKYIFRAAGQVIIFPGFLKLYPEQQKENILPMLEPREKLLLTKLDSLQHFTEPPARYNDASLVKAMEERGIGRPSTYAPTISTVIARQYVERDEKKRLAPTDIGFLVTDILTQHFPQIVDYEFTAKMEDNFDNIAQGQTSWQKVIQNFYEPFEANLKEKDALLTKKELTEEKSDEICDKCGAPMIIKTGRFGRFLACSNYPQCKNTKPLNGFKDETPAVVLDEKCPECGEPLKESRGRFGAFIGCSAYPKCKYIKKEKKGTGVTCPECGQGEIVERRTRSKRIFYSCNRYPDCKFALWLKPTGEKCPQCQSLLVFAAKETKKCSNKECDYVA